MNSKQITQTWYALRFTRWLWRLVWNRRAAWAVVCLISLITVLWQWENWRSARELKDVHRRVVDRLGTDDPFAFMPPSVPDEQNYFANPVLESWLHEKKPGRLGLRYNPPQDALLPKGFISPEIMKSHEGSPGRLDLKSWMAQRTTSTESAASLLAHELGDGNGLLPKLREGLNKPYSIMKPSQREAMKAAGGNPWEAALPNFDHLNSFQHQLGIHVRSAALCHDVEKTASTALIMLRFSEAPVRGGIMGCLLPLSLHGITCDALHEALSYPSWTVESLSRLQARLGQFDELENYEKAHACEILNMFAGLAYIRSHPEDLDGIFNSSPSAYTLERVLDAAFEFAMKKGPIGWHDANVAYYADRRLEQLGPLTSSAWLDAGPRDEQVRARVKADFTWPNPRRILGATAIPHVGNICQTASKTLFQRRCLILACAMEKHRLRHGAFPDSLETVKEDLKLFTLDDPARPGHLLGFRLEKNGYLLWSAGPDAVDDGGMADKDWLWRMN